MIAGSWIIFFYDPHQLGTVTTITAAAIVVDLSILEISFMQILYKA
jgi:hypothetical protein